MSVSLKEIIQYLEGLAPKSSQESYDNSGLIVGDLNQVVTNALVCLDSTEEIVHEAISKNCNLIIAHHPIVFKGLKSFTGKSYVERVVIECIKHNIAIYAIHTNFDNYRFGVNAEIGKRLGLKNLQILAPKYDVLEKLVVYVPNSHREVVLSSLFEAGAGQIGNYGECSFSIEGKGTFTPLIGSNPYAGNVNVRSAEEEVRIEVLVSTHRKNEILKSLLTAHPYEEVAYEFVKIANENKFEGAGMIGELEFPMNTESFLQKVKKDFHCGTIRHTRINKPEIQSVAFCGGSGSFLLKNAIAKKADIYITGDFKYHEFFDADNQIIIADIGHFESEQFTINLLGDILTKKFPNFAVRLTENNTNPINYI